MMTVLVTAEWKDCQTFRSLVAWEWILRSSTEVESCS